MPADPTSVRALASALSVLKPEPALLDAWLGAMRSDAFAFGAGVLRTADDEYDPFGVLAAISLAEWTWVELDDAWGVDGDAMALKPQRVAEWLGVDEPDRLVQNNRHNHTASLIDTVTKVADGATSFEPILDLFDAARRHIEQERDRMAKLRMSEVRGIGDFRSYDDPRFAAHEYISGRRW